MAAMDFLYSNKSVPFIEKKKYQKFGNYLIFIN